MRRVVLCVLSFCMLASPAIFGSPAKAGDVYADHQLRLGQVWYERGYSPWRPGPPLYDVGYDSWRGVDWHYANFLPPPDCRLARIVDIDGTWMWARRAGCL